MLRSAWSPGYRNSVLAANMNDGELENFCCNRREDKFSSFHSAKDVKSEDLFIQLMYSESALDFTTF
jgi:hypothetical protein